ncbi:U6 small nuclear RNA (adenine-(43)-N(6))-methyltransferase isoform X1 [Rhodnius prolixus]
MSMNKFMHPRNPYRNPPDFKKLALDYPEFRKHANQDLSGKVKLNFKDEGAVWSLTKSLLHKDFNLDVNIVEGRLVPTLPLRMNYLLWLEDLINMYKTEEHSVLGVDIGAGACCIYALLASRYFSWRMLATEIDPENYQCAIDNVKRNKLETDIEVKKVEEGTYLCGALNENIKYDFCMCNPPFFGDDRESKRRHELCSEPRNAPSGTNVELATKGGEISFVKTIIDDSTKVFNSIRIYTVMLGCKSSLSPLKDYLKQKKVASYATTMFCQGRTTRWGLAWTYDLTLDLSTGFKPQNKKQSVSYNYSVPLSESLTFLLVEQKLLDFFKKLEIASEIELREEGILIMTLKARSNTWVNSRRRRREEKRKALLQSSQSNEDNPKLINDGSSEGSSKNEVVTSGNVSKRTCDTKESSVQKKLKTEQNDVYYLVASLALKDLGNELNLEIIYLNGNGGKDCSHQLLQCIKNEFK